MADRRVVAVVAVVLSVLVVGPLASLASAQDVIYLVRHAERLDDSKDSPLSAEGTARAAALARILKDEGITAVFATQFKRTIDTARPLADLLGVPVRTVTAGQNADLLAQVRAVGPHARVLIVGHGDTVPELLTALGHPTAITIAKGEYDSFFIIVPGGRTEPLVLRLRF